MSGTARFLEAEMALRPPTSTRLVDALEFQASENVIALQAYDSACIVLFEKFQVITYDELHFTPKM